MRPLPTRPGVNPSYLVRRHLLLSEACAPLAALETRLVPLVGFERVELVGRRLSLSYDASKLQLDALLEALEAAGIALDPGRWNRFRVGWYRHTDNNIYHNARDTSSSSCAQSPLRHR